MTRLHDAVIRASRQKLLLRKAAPEDKLEHRTAFGRVVREELAPALLEAFTQYVEGASREDVFRMALSIERRLVRPTVRSEEE